MRSTTTLTQNRIFATTFVKAMYRREKRRRKMVRNCFPGLNMGMLTPRHVFMSHFGKPSSIFSSRYNLERSEAIERKEAFQLCVLPDAYMFSPFKTILHFCPSPLPSTTRLFDQRAIISHTYQWYSPKYRKVLEIHYALAFNFPESEWCVNFIFLAVLLFLDSKYVNQVTCFRTAMVQMAWK